MNKIEELEKQLKEEMSKIQVDLKEKYKWIVGKYAKYKERLIIFQMKDSRNIKSSCQIPIKRNFVSRDIIM